MRNWLTAASYETALGGLLLALKMKQLVDRYGLQVASFSFRAMSHFILKHAMAMMSHANHNKHLSYLLARWARAGCTSCLLTII